MQKSNDLFELKLKAGTINVNQHLVSNVIIYRIIFSDHRIPLIITRALTNNAEHWWTSVPEGRQKEANEIGPLIAAYIQSNQL